ncbi:T9SS C-terminal target domain-containing protein [Mariniphaga sediminis]|jgi:hypothetical protein|uniref:T9SS C-terminal target domain-containing protein n=1 Tax=Mariniphaga sediminis TaxID=1628158 RepID=A0A399CWC0_9BACT|nr:T9SS type A sorting domain-containing protein [Mariniphaga sediminis]RIH63523.1 T9SS C-terminal target domain-containing protein [Mariniphaga sediminis]
MVFFSSASQKIQMRANDQDGTMAVSLFSPGGQLVRQNTLRSTGRNGLVDIFCTRGLSPGLYLVAIEMEKEIQCSKIVIFK